MTDEQKCAQVWDDVRPIGGKFWHELDKQTRDMAVACFKEGKAQAAATQQNQSPVVTDEHVVAERAYGYFRYVVADGMPERDAFFAALKAALSSGRLHAGQQPLEDYARQIQEAVLSCPHSITGEEIVIGYSSDQPGHNALAQLNARILSAIEPAQAPEGTTAEADEDVFAALQEQELLDGISSPVPSHAETVSPYATALRMIRDAVGELFGPVSDLESEEAVLLRGPEPHHEAEAIIAGLQRVKQTLLEAEQRGRRQGMEDASNVIQDELENLTSHDPGVCLDMVLRALQAKLDEVQS